MKTEAFLNAYNMSRNGANSFFSHGLVKKFHYSDGVKDCAEAGCYWLLDIFATEVPPLLLNSGEALAIVQVIVEGSKATLRLEPQEDGGSSIEWTREIEWTDMPEGSYNFYIADEGTHFSMILPSEY